MDPQLNYDYHDGDDDNNLLPQNMDVNGFENVANRDDFGFNTITLHEILCHIENGNILPTNFTIENMMILGFQMYIFQPIYSTTQLIGITVRIAKK